MGWLRRECLSLSCHPHGKTHKQQGFMHQRPWNAWGHWFMSTSRQIPQKVQAAAAAGNVAVTPAQPVSTIIVKNYLKQGDSVTIGFDTRAKKIISYNVDSYLDQPKDDAVKLAVNFAGLPDGTNYVQQSVLDATGKKIEVKVMNSDYKKLGQ
jgi:hypothetical protein